MQFLSPTRQWIRGEGKVMARLFCYMMAMVMAMLALPVRAEDGYDLWLRYAPAHYRKVTKLVLSKTPCLQRVPCTR